MPLLDFLPSAPSNSVPRAIYNFLKKPVGTALPNGEAKYAPYSVRKIEAALLKENKREDVVVPHLDYLNRFIGKDTKVIAVSTMDPLGYGPLTASYSVLFGSNASAWVRVEWEELIERINRARKGTNAKLLVGGPGVWDFTIEPEALEREHIDYAFQGEADDLAPLIFKSIEEDSFDSNLFYKGYTSFDENFKMKFIEHERFISRRLTAKGYPSIDEIPNIVRPSMKSITEVMRGCGIGCDFCEVTLRPSRYYPVEKIKEEVEVNIRQGGFDNAWLHSDEIFTYKHDPYFHPNEEALIELFEGVMSIKGVEHANPTHGRISIPAAYPELISKLSNILHAGPSNWIGIQVGVETGSEELAKKHMPNKTLPLHMGVDGSWQDIVWQGTYNFNKYYWRPAFTVQVGQPEETDEDNWETVRLINRLSNSTVDGRPFEFTITPMQNVPMGKLKNREFSASMLNASQLAVYYAAYRHLVKMAKRDGYREAKSNFFIARIGVANTLALGATLLLKVIENIAKKHGTDIEKAKTIGTDEVEKGRVVVIEAKNRAIEQKGHKCSPF